MRGDHDLRLDGHLALLRARRDAWRNAFGWMALIALCVVLALLVPDSSAPTP